MNYVLFTFLLLFYTNALAAVDKVYVRNLQVAYDVALLQEEIEHVADYYMPRHRNNMNWTAIPLRNATGTIEHEGIEFVHTIKRNEMLPCLNTEYLEQLPYTMSVLDDIAERFETEIGLVRLSKVPSLKEISPHADGMMFDLEGGTVYRLHIPIVTGEDVLFTVANNSYNLEPGFLYYANVSETHSVTNNGPIDRIHLVIDVHATPALKAHILLCP